MNKKLVLLTIVLVVSVGLLSGCNESEDANKSDKNRLVGTWFSSYIYNGSIHNSTWILFSNGTLDIVESYENETYSLSGNWYIFEGNLSFHITKPTILSITNEYILSDDSNLLTILTIETDENEPVTFNKQ